ncbi:MAG: hypothetical protein AAF449_06250, partial [Myxococcota bacterium]
MTDTAFRVDPGLLGADLASPRRRGAALMVDLILAAIVSGLEGPGVFAVLAGIVIYRLLTKAEQKRFRWLRTMGAGVVALIAFSSILSVVSNDDVPSDRSARGPVDTSTSAVALGNAVGEVFAA